MWIVVQNVQQRRMIMRSNYIFRNDTVKKRTAIGDSNLSRPKNKNKRRSWKKYRGQGK